MKLKSDGMRDLHHPKRSVSSSSAYDVIVVGAGLQGCATALNLVQRKQRVLLLEKKTAGRGAWGDRIAAMIGDSIPLQAEAPTMMVT